MVEILPEIKSDQIDQRGISFKFYNFESNEVKRFSKKIDVGICNDYPGYETHYNALYIPFHSLGKDLRRFSCLYSHSGKIINSSKLFVDQNNRSVCLAPEEININSNLEPDQRKYIYIGFLLEHYGHFITESLSRLWFYLINNTEDYYLLYHSSDDYHKNILYTELLGALGISSDKLIRFEKATIVSKVIIPNPSFTIRGKAYNIHDKLVNTTAKFLTKNMGKIKPTSQPLYLSRRLLSDEQRLVKNESKLEDILIKKGVNVQHPQFLNLAEQIYLINRHQTVIGTLGSALHSVLFSINKNKYSIVLTKSKDGSNSTQLLIDLLKHNQLSYINCLKDIDSEKTQEISPGQRNLSLDLEIAVEVLKELGVV
jgi:hypothetical protein